MAEPADVTAQSEVKLKSWPSPQDYNEAVQNLSDNSDDPQLQKGHVELTSLGLPRPLTGAFASVYRVHTEGASDVAVRCFLRDISDQQERYRHISNFVQNDDLPYTVTFDFLAEGIRVGGHWLPALKMDWVQGLNLDAFVEKHHNEKNVMAELAASFKKMCFDLHAAGIAHGDLQHGNIIVCGDELRLVDYDGMYVPAMAGMHANEVGHRNYQHPARGAEDFGAELDNFSAWVIYASLRALSLDPKLYETLGAGDDCLLFRHDDFLQPEYSFAFGYLEQHKNEEVRALARFVRAQCHRAPMDVPPLADQIPSITEELPPLSAVAVAAPQSIARMPSLAANFIAPMFRAGGLPAWLRDTPRAVSGSASAAALARSRAQFASAFALALDTELNQPLPRYITLDKTGAHGAILDPLTTHLLHLVNPAFWLMFVPLINPQPMLVYLAFICFSLNAIFEFGYWYPRFRDRHFVRNGTAATARVIGLHRDPANEYVTYDRYYLGYEYDVAPGKEFPRGKTVTVNKAVDKDTYQFFKTVKQATVLYDPSNPEWHMFYNAAMYDAIVPIIPTGVEPALLPRKRMTVLSKDVDSLLSLGCLFCALLPQ